MSGMKCSVCGEVGKPIIYWEIETGVIYCIECGAEACKELEKQKSAKTSAV